VWGQFEMVGLEEHGGLMLRFAEAKPEHTLHAEKQSKLTTNQRINDEMGLKSGSVEGIHKTSAAATKDAQDSRDAQAERRGKQQISDALFLELLRTGELDTYIAENVFGGMNDAEINNIVSMIETETGQSFGSYSRGILDQDMPTRSNGESDVDYNRRVVIAVSAEILDGQGNVLPQYENDPLAKYIKREASYIEIVEHRDRINAANPNGIAPTADATATVSEIAATNYDAGDILRDGLVNDELGRTSRDIQDEARDASMDALPDNSSGFGALSMASMTLNENFEAASVLSVENTEIAQEPTVDLNPVTPT